MSTEQLLLEHWHHLSDEKQAEVLNFVEFLRTKQPLSSEQSARSKRQFPPAKIAGKGKTIGDIVSPIVDEQDWECLK